MARDKTTPPGKGKRPESTFEQDSLRKEAGLNAVTGEQTVIGMDDAPLSSKKAKRKQDDVKHTTMRGDAVRAPETATPEAKSASGLKPGKPKAKASPPLVAGNAPSPAAATRVSNAAPSISGDAMPSGKRPKMGDPSPQKKSFSGGGLKTTGGNSNAARQDDAPPAAKGTGAAHTLPMENNSRPEGGQRQETADLQKQVAQAGKKASLVSAADFLSDFDLYLLQEGTHQRAYEKMGAHPVEGGVHFAVWAPNATRVSVVGHFNQWDGNRNHLSPRNSSGIWTGFVEGIKAGETYKYEMHDHNGHLLPLKSDPYGFFAEVPPATASIVANLPQAPQDRPGGQTRRDPISIYEVHLGSWRRGDGNRVLSYRELAEQLVPYAKDMGFTHLELLPVSEHPFNGSWGYQPIGLFAPTSRYGTPEDFRFLIDKAHEAGLKVLLDWVPGHFPNDAHGLAYFDGTALYNHADPRQGAHMDWGTLIYNYGRTEVLQFLLSNALYWCDIYGIDGLRVDAVASMIYLNYSRKEGEWVPNRFGGVENLEATAFLRRMNELLYGAFPNAITVAEESTSFPGVSQPTFNGGLGFGYKWNMGWMHDTLDYISSDPIYRKYHHHRMTFGMVYAYSENFILPISHDEVVHGKGSLLGRMPGDEWQKFANLRAYLGFMFAHPGKKLLFMGCEFGQGREWDHDHSLDWHQLEHWGHAGTQRLVRDLNHLYSGIPALHWYDCEPAGFDWLQSDAADLSIYSFLRKGDNEDNFIVAVCNFTPLPHEHYRIPVPRSGFYAEIFNSDAAVYGGSNMGNAGGLNSTDVAWHGRDHSLLATIPPLATVYFRFQKP